jgi:hypothetical protein
MKNIIFCLFSLLFFARSAAAQDGQLYWKYKDYDGINFAVGRAIFDIASLFAEEKEERRLLSRIKKVRLLVFEDHCPIKDRDLRKFERRAKRRHLEELVTIRDGKDNVRILAKERRGALRKVVVFVKTPEEFVMVGLKGTIRWNEINDLIDEYGSKAIKKKDNEEKTREPLKKVPVVRI